MTLDSNQPTLTHTAYAPTSVDEDPDDSGYGWLMFIGFLAAVMSITFTVCVLALAGSWWMLGVAMAVHVGITAIMMTVVWGAFRAQAYPDLERTELASNSLLAQQRRARVEAHPASLATPH